MIQGPLSFPKDDALRNSSHWRGERDHLHKITTSQSLINKSSVRLTRQCGHKEMTPTMQAYRMSSISKHKLTLRLCPYFQVLASSQS
jgi:hypothetical protein